MRSLRINRQWTQADLAARAGVSQCFVSRTERGKFGSASLLGVRAVADALDAHLEFRLQWRGGELDRLLNRRHSAMHELVAGILSGLPGWDFAPEVSYSVYGERGVIDILAWHPASATLMVIELKTEIVDVQELIGKLDQKRRLAPGIGRDRGWASARTWVWVIVADGRTNRRRVEAHQTTLRAAFPADGRQIARMLRMPDRAGSTSALSFLSNSRDRRLKSSLATTKRVRRRRSSVSSLKKAV
jgi:transcriptional regulator with XRE-family HTH domain